MDTDEQTRQQYDDRDEDTDTDTDTEADELHTHVLVGTDEGDECEICGWQADPFHGIGDEYGIDWDGRVG